MKAKGLLALIAVAGFAILLAASGIQAATEVADVIKMETGAYEKHTKGIVEFNHKQHYEEYGIDCGKCHHDAQGQPLTGLKPGDDVQPCIECHKETDFDPADKKMKKAEKIAKYHKEALHENCIGCHRDHNKENKIAKSDPKAAPTSCKDCHPKK